MFYLYSFEVLPETIFIFSLSSAKLLQLVLLNLTAYKY